MGERDERILRRAARMVMPAWALVAWPIIRAVLPILFQIFMAWLQRRADGSVSGSYDLLRTVERSARSAPDAYLAALDRAEREVG